MRTNPLQPNIDVQKRDAEEWPILVETLIRHLDRLCVVACHYWATLEEGKLADRVSDRIRDADLACAQAMNELCRHKDDRGESWKHQKLQIHTR